LVGAAGEGARLAASSLNSATVVKQAVVDEAAGSGGVTIDLNKVYICTESDTAPCSTRESRSPGSGVVKVIVRYDFQPITPLIDRIFGSTWQLEASALRQVI
jgi:hypothetical protein